MLRKKFKNRPIKQSHVEKLANQMVSGRWVFNGEPIIIDKFGRVIDGGHRLNAVIESDCEFDFCVIRGVEPETSFETIDTGKTKSVSDILACDGEIHQTNLAGAIRVVMSSYQGFLGSHSAISITPSQARKFLKDHPKIRESVKACVRPMPNGIRRSILSGLHYLFVVSDKGDSTYADAFVSALADGVGLGRNDPRRRLLFKCIETGNSGHVMKAETFSALTIKAWNAFRAGEDMHALRYTKDESFPKIAGLKITRE
jgi:hypothetical protein